MSKLKCAKCGKTFGDNEPVIGIAEEGKPESPFCTKCVQEMTGESLPTKKKEKCFVATAACCDENAWEVFVLRDYRDCFLLKSSLGRAFVQTYYLLSPMPARLLSRSACMCAVVRRALIEPLALLIQKSRE